MKRLFAPFYASILISLGLIAGGFFGVGLGWYGVARNAEDFIQLPYLVTGGLTGLGLIGMGLSIIRIQLQRREAEIESNHLTDLANAAGKLLAALKERRTSS